MSFLVTLEGDYDYQITVITTTEGEVGFKVSFYAQLTKIVKNTIYQLKLFRQAYGIHSIVFSQSPAILEYCKQVGVLTLPVTHTNEYGMPTLRSMIEIARRQFSSEYVVYINSDILINPNIFRAIYHSQSILGTNVGKGRD